MTAALRQGLQRLRDQIHIPVSAGDLQTAARYAGDAPVYRYNPVTDWTQSFFYVYDTESLLDLYPAQSAPLTEAMRRDKNGHFVYHTVLWSWMKKSAKSTIIAAVADYTAMMKPKASIKLIANDVKQADSRVGYYMRQNILIGARRGYPYDPNGQIREMRGKTRITSSGYLIEYPNGSRVEMIPIDPRGEAGGNDDMIVFSELWGWKHKSHQDMWAEMTLSPTRYGRSQRWIDTYAGYRDESPILEQLYDTVVKDRDPLPIPENPECYAVDGIFATWVTVPRLPWQTADYYRNEHATLSEDQFLRMHRNQWVQSIDAFITEEQWDSCIDPDTQPLNEYDEIVIALDAGLVNDTFAMVAVSRDRRATPWGQNNNDAPDVFVRRYARAWTPPKGGELRFNDPDDLESPAAELRRLCDEYNVVQVCYDPWQLAHFASEMRDEGLADFVAFQQGTEREIADKQLYDMIRAKRLKHSGHDETLKTHLLNANRHIISDRKLRIVKRTEDKKIDLAVALSMACKRGLDVIPK